MKNISLIFLGWFRSNWGGIQQSCGKNQIRTNWEIIWAIQLRSLQFWKSYQVTENKSMIDTLHLGLRSLSASVMATSGDVIELGTGYFSTPMLHLIISQQVTHKLVSLVSYVYVLFWRKKECSYLQIQNYLGCTSSSI